MMTYSQIPMGLIVLLVLLANAENPKLMDETRPLQKEETPARHDMSVGLKESILKVSSWGTGETLIMLPGQGCSVVGFEALAPAIAVAGFKVIAVNPRGIAGSSGRLDGLTLHGYASDIAGLINEISHGRAHILGWAFGNRIARCVASDYPELVRTVTLLAAGGKVPPDDEALNALSKILEAQSSDKELIELFHTSTLLSRKSDPANWLHLIESWTDGSAAQVVANRATPVEDWWAGGMAPMLVIQGLDDRLAPPGNGRALKEAYRDRVKLVEFEDAGHAFVVEHPDAIAHAVVEFLQEHPIGKRQ